jgi:hypothetical protein
MPENVDKLYREMRQTKQDMNEKFIKMIEIILENPKCWN